MVCWGLKGCVRFADFDAPVIRLTRSRVIKFGPIPVRLHLDVKRRDSAFVLAGPELYRFDLPSGEFRAAQICFNDTADFQVSFPLRDFLSC